MEQDFESVFYPPGLMRGLAGTSNHWTAEQRATLLAAGFEPHQSKDVFSGKDLSTGAIRVVRGSTQHQQLLKLFEEMRVSPAERIEPIRVPKKLADYAYYQIDFGDPSDGFEGADIFERQFDCGQPPPEGPHPGPRGCGLDKPQVRKLRAHSAIVPRAEIVPAWVPPYCENWRLLVVTRRVYQLLTEANCSGIRFYPVLDAGKRYSADELALDYVDHRQIAEAKYFQLSIVARARPVPLAGVDRNNPCPKCGRWNGVELTTVDSYRWSRKGMASTDFQVVSEYQLPDGSLIQKKGYDRIVASARIVEVLVKSRVRGISMTKSNASFAPLYLVD